MTEEKFLARWSRLKRDGTHKETASPDPAKPGAREATGDEDQADGQSTAPRDAQAAETVDLASLPSLESIVADTDISGFMQRGVPAALTRAALRRAWVADPAIRDFIGLAENQWDFTDPNAMYGFGPLHATDNVAQLVEQATGKLQGPALTESEPAMGGTNPQKGEQQQELAGSSAAPDEQPSDAGSEKTEVTETADASTSRRTTAEEPDIAVQDEIRTAQGAPLHNRRARGGALPE